jgi:hypothetical protein
MTVWFLVVFVKFGYAGGVVVMPHPYITTETCRDAASHIVAAPGPSIDQRFNGAVSGKATDIEAVFCVPGPAQ